MVSRASVPSARWRSCGSRREPASSPSWRPSLPEPALAAEWVDTAVVLYLGKAGPGSKGNRGLRRQVQEFLDFGQGKPPGHWDGRLVWQLADAEKLLIAWKELPAEHLGKAEADYHTAFVEEHGKLPFANLVRARTKG
jgi:hypothetical protein